MTRPFIVSWQQVESILLPVCLAWIALGCATDLGQVLKEMRISLARAAGV